MREIENAVKRTVGAGGVRPAERRGANEIDEIASSHDINRAYDARFRVRTLSRMGADGWRIRPTLEYDKISLLASPSGPGRERPAPAIAARPTDHCRAATDPRPGGRYRAFWP